MSYKNQTDKEKLIITSLSSIVAGGIGRVVCHPIDTVKAKLQVETSRITSKNMVSNLLWKITKQTYQTEGLRGFYQGIGIATLGSIPALTLFFTSYEYARILLTRKNIMDSNEHLRNFTCGMVAEAVSCVLFVPIDVIKERLQVQSNLKTFYYKNTFDAIRTILKVEGVSGLYRAYGATLMSFGPFSALSLTAYDGLKKRFIPEDKEIGLLESIFLAGTSGSIASIITNPMDLAKLRMQVQRAEGYSSSASGENGAKRFQYRNMFHGMYTIASNEGLLALFRGSLARSLYQTPSIGILLSVLDYTRGVVTKLMY